MSINLQKGQKIEVNPLKVRIGLGWDPNPGTGQDFDLDCSVFMLDKNKMIPNEKNFVFYNNPESPCKSVKHSGDDKTGSKSNGGDDETISINTGTLNSDIVELLFVVSIHTNQNFGQVRDSYIRIINDETNEEIAKFLLDEDFSIEKSVEFGRLYLIDGVWKFAASGVGYTEGLDFFVSKYFAGIVTK